MNLLDETYTNDRGTYNVTRARRDAEAGLHALYLFDNLPACVAANSKVEIDADKIKRFAKAPEILTKPLLFVSEDDRLWLIDGHHRLRALHQLGQSEFTAYVIEAKDVTRYRIEIRALAAGVVLMGSIK